MSWRPAQDNEEPAPAWPEPTLRKDNDEAEPDLGPYKDAYDAASPETQDAIRAALERKDPDTPLLYELLGSGTPPFKMPQDAADYQDPPVETELGRPSPGDWERGGGGPEENPDWQGCKNCEYYYEGAGGSQICSKIRGEVHPDGWCRLWQSINEEPQNESA